MARAVARAGCVAGVATTRRRKGTVAMIKKILVPVDGSDHANAAVDWASDIGAKYQARLTVLHVMAERGSGQVPEELRQLAQLERIEITERDILQSAANQIVEAAKERARMHGIHAIDGTIGIGDPARVIVDQAKAAGVDLIVMGRRGLGGLPGLLLGSVSNKVLHLAACACLTVRSPA
jgi:nucleotide-binding universal stress UspA family protein